MLTGQICHLIDKGALDVVDINITGPIHIHPVRHEVCGGMHEHLW